MKGEIFMFKYLLMLIVCGLLIYIVVKVSSFIEKKLKETSGWKTDTLVITSVFLTIILTGVGFYSLIKLLLYIFVY